MTFKVGDKVRVRDDKHSGLYNDCAGIIEKVRDEPIDKNWTVEVNLGDGGPIAFAPDELELIEEDAEVAGEPPTVDVFDVRVQAVSLAVKLSDPWMNYVETAKSFEKYLLTGE